MSESVRALGPLVFATLVAVTSCDRGIPSQPADEKDEAAIMKTVRDRERDPEVAQEATSARSPESEVEDPLACAARFEFDSSRSVRDEFNAAGGQMRDFPERYRAEFIDPDSFTPAKSVERFQIGKTPLLWFTPDAKQAIVNAAVLSDLIAVEPMSQEHGERAVLGTLNELGRGKIGGRELLEFLMQSEAIRTYVHIGSEVCIERETSGEDGAYFAHVSGVHTFFTNEENSEPFRFDFELTAAGEIAVTAR